MPRYEYMVLSKLPFPSDYEGNSMMDTHDMQKSLNELGEQGWELITSYTEQWLIDMGRLTFNYIIFRRPKEAPDA